ncbi:MAG: MarR family winged helix-turn-helix transcriptional regulator [Burkholderiaceae bacterium]|nr:MarR family winged helix-turn-helix transcriptional regulator [Burkholderiaceae bacterium]
MPVTAVDYRFTEQIGFLLRRAYQRHTSIFKEIVPDSQLTAAQFVVLCTIQDQPGCQVRDIAEATAIDEPSVRGILERLKWRELITVSHEPGDARHVEIALTPGGRTVVDTVTPLAAQISELTFGDLDESERASVIALLRRLSGQERGAAE